MEKKYTFATMVATGEKPDVEIHIAGFRDGDGMTVASEIGGCGADVMQAFAHTVGDYLTTCKNEGGRIAAGLFALMIQHEIMKILKDNPSGGDEHGEL